MALVSEKTSRPGTGSRLWTTEQVVSKTKLVENPSSLLSLSPSRWKYGRLRWRQWSWWGGSWSCCLRREWSWRGGHHVVDASAKYGREENYSEVDPSVEDCCDKNNPDVDAYVCAKKGPPQGMISKILKSTRSSKRKVVGTGLLLHRQNQVNPTQSHV